jgi:phage terminase large subunit-like protein
MVIAADAGVNNDSFGVVGCTRATAGELVVACRYAREWKPGKHHPIDFSEVEAEIRRLCAEFNVIEFTYDPYQLHDMATRLQREGIVKTKPFQQGADRLEADKQLLDLIMQKRIFHDGDATLKAHIDHADKKVDTETRKLRIIKRQEDLKIDLAVALSMAAYRCLKLPL